MSNSNKNVSRADSDQRLKELILDVSDRCDSHTNFGATKLNKILFYADFVAYARLGQPITGAEYQKLENGPAPRRLVPLRNELTSSGEAVIRDKAIYARTQKRLVPLRAANLGGFTGAEIAIVDEVIEALKDRTATEVSELSHQLAGWQLAESGETIPYCSVLLPRSDWSPDDETIAAGKALAAGL